MAKYDVEMLFADVGSLIANKLNTFISAINTEKSDSITLAALDTTNGIFFQTPQYKTIAVDPIVIYGQPDDFTAEGIGPQTMKHVEVEIALVLLDSGSDSTVPKRLLRYQRAIMDMVEANWSTIGTSASKVKLIGKQMTPSFALFNEQNLARAIGASFQVRVG